MKLPFSAGQVYTDTLIWVTERCRLVGTLWHATQGDEGGVRKTSVKANSDPLSGMKLMSSENVQLEDVWTCLLCLAVCLQPGQLKGCWIQVMVSVSGIVIDQVTRDYWLFWWLDQSSPSVSVTQILSLPHAHIKWGCYSCTIVSVGWSICRGKKMHRLEQTGIQKTEKRKEKKGTLFWPRQWVCDCVSVLLFIVSLGYETKLFSRGLMAGEQRTIG